MKTKRRKRKEGQVNYNITCYSGEDYRGNLVIGRSHPYFKNAPLESTLLDGGQRVWEIRSYYGNQTGTYPSISVKKKFRNMNYRIFVVYDNPYGIWPPQSVSKEEFREGVLKFRWKLIEAYIKHKRGIK